MLINISTSEAIFRWRPAGWLRVTGDDALTFLQGQFTHDLRALERAPAVYGLWLNLKGKVVADSFVLKGDGPGEFWIGSYFSSAASIRERLESHIIADDVSIEDCTAAWAGVCLLNAGSIAPGSRPPHGLVFPARRGGAQDVEWMYPLADGEPAGISAATVPALEPEAMERRRIAAGIPAVPRDVGLADLPNEAGLDAVAISYTKGCYLGQEVMARLKSMGQVRRRLWRVRGDGAEPPVLPAAVFAGARQVGELRSAVRADGGWIGLAMVTLMHVSGGAPLSFAPDGPNAVRLNPEP